MKKTRRLVSRSSRSRKLSKAEEHATATEINHQGFSSYDLMCRLQVKDVEVRETAEEIERLKARILELKRRLESDQAEALGLSRILESRQSLNFLK